MPDKKDLSQIRPPKGSVKIKNKQTNMDPLKRPKPKIIQNIQEKVTEETPPPKEEAVKMVAEINEAKAELINAMKNFNKLLNNSKLPENKSEKEKQEEPDAVNRLANAAIKVENLSPGEGLLGLCILSIRQSLSLRDAGNMLSYKIFELEKKVKKLFPEEEDPNAEAKRQLKEMAEKLGLKATFSEGQDENL